MSESSFDGLTNEVFVSKICRTCLVDLGTESFHINTKYLFNSDPNELIEFDIKTMLIMLTPLQFKRDDYCPQEICDTCLRKLKDSFEFRLQCIKSDANFRKTNMSLSFDFDRTAHNLSFDSVVFDFLNTKPKTSIDESVSLFDNTPELNTSENNICESENITECVIKNDNFKSPSISQVSLCFKKSENISVNSEKDSDHIDYGKAVCKKGKKSICDICGKQFPRRNGLFKKHMIRHSDTKDFQCSLCDKSFHTKDDLNKHKLSHSTKNYICHSCGSSFSRKDSLKKHMNIHLNIKPEACPYCPKRFLNAYNLKNHIRVHLNDSPFICTVCNRAFKQRTSLLRHMKIHKPLQLQNDSSTL